MSDSSKRRFLEGETVTDAVVRSDDRADGVTETGLILPGVFPPERVEARVIHVGKRSAHGKLLRILDRHPRRRLPPCPNARRPEAPKEGGRCDGCPLMAIDEEAQRALKAERLRMRHWLPIDRVSEASPPVGYRFSSKRVAFGGPGRLTLGSWQRGTHKPATMEGCLVDHPRIAAAFDEVQAVARERGVDAYDERSGQGSLRYVWAKTDGDQVLLTLISAQDDPHPMEELAGQLTSVAGVTFAVQAGEGNVMRGEAPRLLRGVDTLEVPFGEAKVAAQATGFLQPNPAAVVPIYEALLNGPNGEPLAGARALDLYAGVGLTTARLAERFEGVRGCEADPSTGGHPAIETTTAEAFLEARVAEGAPVDLVVANPPRAGLRATVCDHLLALRSERIHLMSCGPAGLAKDLRRLEGAYEVERVTAWDTLPQTPHVEIVAWLRRREPPEEQP